jgi:hypothetical protein
LIIIDQKPTDQAAQRFGRMGSSPDLLYWRLPFKALHTGAEMQASASF